MVQFTNQQFDQLEQRVLRFMQKNREIINHSLWVIRFGMKAIDHMKGMDKKHSRDKNAIYMRYLCALSIKNILEHIWYHQEYKKIIKPIKVKRKWVIISENKEVEYFGFVAIIPTGKWSHRIKVIVEKVDGRSHYDVLSVIPSWNPRWGYSRFDSDDDFDQ